MLAALKTLCNHFLSIAGLELRIKRPAPPIVYPTPPDALSNTSVHQPAAFIGQLAKCTTYNGFTFDSDGWHPFVATINEYLDSHTKSYKGSILQRYYSQWQPTNGQEALIGAGTGPDILANHPPFLIHAPWLTSTLEERAVDLPALIKAENERHGEEDLPIEEGYSLQGPVSERKGKLEYNRLLRVLYSIRKDGYDQSYQPITAQVLLRGDEERYRIVHGHHRTAALAALGYSHLVLVPTMVVQAKHVQDWPQVHQGPWSAQEALHYFDHHFDFNPLLWATNQGLAS